MSQDKDKLPAELARTDENWRRDPVFEINLQLAMARVRAERLRQELAEAEAAERNFCEILGEEYEPS